MSQRGEDEGEGHKLAAPKEQAQGQGTSGAKTVHAHIGDSLRRMFDEVVEEPIPEKFKALLESLEKAKTSN